MVNPREYPVCRSVIGIALVSNTERVVRVYVQTLMS
jgi:hypothetical protein